MHNHEEHNSSIVFVLPSVKTGGAERAIIALTNNLNFPKKTLISISGGEKPQILSEGVFYSPLHAKRTLLSIVPLLKEIHRIKPAAIVSTIAHLNFLIISLRPFLPKNSKIIVREATSPLRFIENAWMGRHLTRILYKHLYTKADLVLCPSDSIFNELGKLGIPTRNLNVLYNSVDEEDLRQIAQREHDSNTLKNSDLVRYVCVGRLHDAKGYDRLIRALEFFRPPFNWTLTIVGEGAERANLEALIKQCELSKNIHLVGESNNPWRYMKEADALILPSRWEGMPNVALESLAIGTPVISTKDAGGISDIARLADAEDVIVAKDMDALLLEMSKFSPKAEQANYASKLPKAFRRVDIMDKARALIEAVIKAE